MPQPPDLEPELLIDSASASAPESPANHTEESYPSVTPAPSPARQLEVRLREADEHRAWAALTPSGEFFAAHRRQAGPELRVLTDELSLLHQASNRAPTAQEEEAQRHASEELRRKILETVKRWAGEDGQELPDQPESASEPPERG